MEDPAALAKADINHDLSSAYQRNRTVMIGSRNGRGESAQSS